MNGHDSIANVGGGLAEKLRSRQCPCMVGLLGFSVAALGSSDRQALGGAASRNFTRCKNLPGSLRAA